MFIKGIYMPNIKALDQTMLNICKYGSARLSGNFHEMAKKTKFVENTTNVITTSPLCLNEFISDTLGRFLYKNTTVCVDGSVRVYKLGGKHATTAPKSTVTIFSQDKGFRQLKEVWERGTRKREVFAYDENGLKPVRVPEMVMNILI